MAKIKDIVFQLSAPKYKQPPADFQISATSCLHWGAVSCDLEVCGGTNVIHPYFVIKKLTNESLTSPCNDVLTTQETKLVNLSGERKIIKPSFHCSIVDDLFYH